MKRFQFSLAQVRDFRRQQLDLEEVKLQKLHAERRELEAEYVRLGNEDARTRASLMVTGSAQSQELFAADSYLRSLKASRRRQGEKLTEWGGRASKQTGAVVEARRRMRLMEKLEEKQFGDWKEAADREQENLSAELYLARWKAR
jgi:flagellar export protein FliJ